MRFLGLLLLGLAAAPLPAQRLSIGILGGAAVTPAFDDTTWPAWSTPASTRTWSPHRDWLAGATLDLHLTSALSVEADGIYRKLTLNYATQLGPNLLSSASPSPVVTWEFPILAKYRLPGRTVRPFLLAGPSFRTAGNLNGTSPSHIGFTTGAGLERHFGAWSLSPLGPLHPLAPRPAALR